MCGTISPEGKKRSWGSLRPMSAIPAAMSGRSPFTHLVVLDFEWTADDKRPMLPISEITQFPSVLVQLSGRTSCVVDEYNSYVKPTLNPVLTPFSTQLTAITQTMVNASPPLPDVLGQYLAWLQSHGLVDERHSRVGNWSFCTWSDADIGSQLTKELRFKDITMPPCFDRWVDLKTLYRQHYKREPRGLQKCVEALGLEFRGRAHDGLVDSQNTAEIVLVMARGSSTHPSFVFRRATRGLDREGNVFGAKRNKRT